jgi:hypothetical protein
MTSFRLFSPGTPREVSAGTPDGQPDDTSPSRGLMRFVGFWGGAYVPGMTMLPRLREDRPGRGGDHEAFIAEGMPGVRFIEVNENLQHQHTAHDLVDYVNPEFTANVTRVVASVAAALARAPSAPQGLAAERTGPAIRLSWTPPQAGPEVDHYVIAARTANENFYRVRLAVSAQSLSREVSTAELGLGEDARQPFFVSVAAADRDGHESLFAYPEFRCAASACVIPDGALDVTATR